MLSFRQIFRYPACSIRTLLNMPARCAVLSFPFWGGCTAWGIGEWLLLLFLIFIILRTPKHSLVLYIFALKRRCACALTLIQDLQNDTAALMASPSWSNSPLVHRSTCLIEWLDNITLIILQIIFTWTEQWCFGKPNFKECAEAAAIPQ